MSENGENLHVLVQLPEDWRRELGEEVEADYFARLANFVDFERRDHAVYPPEQDVFNAFAATSFDGVRVVILGQDPYHDDGQAHGLSFSVQPGIKKPPSLVNIFKELNSDLGCRIPNNGCLTPWARQGVLLLNTVLTVRAHAANSHQGRGWERFTDAVLQKLAARLSPMVFVLWGAHANKKCALIDDPRHAVIKSAHPSPLSARTGFFGSRPFSRANESLRRFGVPEIDWQIGDV